MLVVVDYGLGNLGSIVNMLKKAGATAVVTSEVTTIEQAQKLILPGVGAFDKGMQNLEDRGLVPVLQRRVVQEGVPILGLCLGMQLFMQQSEEGQKAGLGWIAGRTIRFRHSPDSSSLRVPHMGWNFVHGQQADPLLDGLEAEPRFYFVHSYHVVCQSAADSLATTQYGYEFTSMVRHHNIWGTQFHPEKSHRFGLQLMRNFVEKL